MDNAKPILLVGLVGVALGVSVRAFRESSADNDERPKVSAESDAASTLLGGSPAKNSKYSKRVAELETAFSQTICSSETTARVVELLREWGEDDVAGLFRWWKNREFRFLEATMPDTYKFLLRKLAREDVEFAWEIAKALKYNASRFGDLAREIAKIKAKTGTAEEFREFLGEINATVNWDGLERFGYGKAGFYGVLGYVNPKEAIRFVQQIQDPAEQGDAMGALGSLTLDEMLQGLPEGRAKDNALQGLAYRAKNDGDLAMASRALSAMKDSHSRRKTAEIMARQMLAKFDLEGFEQLDDRFGLSANQEIGSLEKAIRLSKARDFDGITHLLEEAPSSELALKIKKTVANSIASHDLDSALSWLHNAGTAGLEDAAPLFRSAISTASNSSDPVITIEKVAQDFPELMPYTDVAINKLHDVDIAESMFELMPAEHKERVIQRWLSRYEVELNAEQVARIKGLVDSDSQ